VLAKYGDVVDVALACWLSADANECLGGWVQEREGRRREKMRTCFEGVKSMREDFVKGEVERKAVAETRRNAASSLVTLTDV
jgi:hypothetical protein